jgi:MraZ protein
MSANFGEYNVSMDAKGRFMLPAEFRKRLQEEDSAVFYLKNGRNGCISFYTQRQWEKVAAVLEDLNPLDPDAETFTRLFLDGIAAVSVDSAGRILVPKQLQEHAGLGKELVFWLQGNKTEIWDRSRKEAYLRGSADREAELAKSLFKR